MGDGCGEAETHLTHLPAIHPSSNYTNRWLFPNASLWAKCPSLHTQKARMVREQRHNETNQKTGKATHETENQYTIFERKKN